MKRKPNTKKKNPNPKTHRKAAEGRRRRNVGGFRSLKESFCLKKLEVRAVQAAKTSWYIREPHSLLERNQDKVWGGDLFGRIAKKRETHERSKTGSIRT